MSKKSLNVSSIQNELEGASVFFQHPVSTPTIPQPNQGKERLTKTKKPKRVQTTGVRKSRTPAVPQSGSYELRKYNEYKRLDVRLPKVQHRYLSQLEDDIRDTMPEVQRDNPEHRIITKAAIVRVYIELFRQLDIPINAKRFHNELDLFDALLAGLRKRLGQVKKD